VALRAWLSFPRVLVAPLLGLLILVATLQYRWLGQVSEAELSRLRASSERGARRISRQFDREITRAFLWLATDPETLRDPASPRLRAAYERWLQQAPHPRLVRDVFVLTDGGEAAPVLRRLERGSHRLAEVEWPSGLRPLRSRLVDQLATSPVGKRPGPRVPLDLVAEEIPALIIPVFNFEELVTWRAERRVTTSPFNGFTIALLDLQYLKETLLPDLERQCLSEEGSDYGVAIFRPKDRQIPVYRSALFEAQDNGSDAAVGVFDVRLDDSNRDLLEGMNPTLEPWGRRLFWSNGRGFPAGRQPASERPRADSSGDNGRWRLALVHKAGSLEQVVAGTRNRNLALSVGMLALLSSGVAFLVISERRASRLAQQQMKFVAGVSHELRTPLTVICSAADNLADGLIQDEAQVRRYGMALRSQGRRLTEMVEEILEYVGTYSGNLRYERRPLSLADLVDGVLSACAAEIDAGGFAIEKDFELRLPLVLGDAAGLRRVLQNLVQNALKYSGNSRWIGLRARAGSSRQGPEVLLTVEDRGPGIEPSDLSELFKPFWRSGDAIARQIPGSGLGLSLVKSITEELGGRVTVETQRGVGCRFTLHLPAAASAPEIEPGALERCEETNPFR